MTNHPNRGARGPGANPTPAEIRAAREAAGLTQTQSAVLIHSTLRAWQSWEAPTDDPWARRMHPGLWELYEAKLAGKLPGLQEVLGMVRGSRAADAPEAV